MQDVPDVFMGDLERGKLGNTSRIIKPLKTFVEFKLLHLGDSCNVLPHHSTALSKTPQLPRGRALGLINNKL